MQVCTHSCWSECSCQNHCRSKWRSTSLCSVVSASLCFYRSAASPRCLFRRCSATMDELTCKHTSSHTCSQVAKHSELWKVRYISLNAMVTVESTVRLAYTSTRRAACSSEATATDTPPTAASCLRHDTVRKLDHTRDLGPDSHIFLHDNLT